MRIGAQHHTLADDFRKPHMIRRPKGIDTNVLTETHTAMRTSLMVDGRPYTELILVRHAQQLFTPEARREGGAEGPRLSPRGHEQAQLVARYLSDESVVAIYSSHLQRARQTAQAIVDCAEPRHQVQVREDLREVERLRPITEGAGAPVTQDWAAEFFETRSFDSIPGLESSVSARERLTRQLECIAEEHRHERVVVVAHGGAISIFWLSYSGVPKTCFSLRHMHL